MVPFTAGIFTAMVRLACSSGLVEVADMAEEDTCCQGFVAIMGNVVQARYVAPTGLFCWL